MTDLYLALKMADSDDLEDFGSNRFLPIAHRGFAFLCVDYTELNTGKIFFIETNNPIDEKTFPIHYVAESLDIFFEMLRPLEID